MSEVKTSARKYNRNFTAFTETQAESTGIGITEVGAGNKTLAIWSLYFPRALSRREKASEIADIIEPLIKPDEYGRVSSIKVTTDKANARTHGTMRQYNDSATGKHREAKLLCQDALRRGTSIAEVLEDMNGGEGGAGDNGT